MSRDPSSFVVAFVLPVLLLFLFGFGISFDATRLKVGLVIEEPTPAAREFLTALSNTPYFDVRESSDRRAFIDDLSAGKLNGVIVLVGRFHRAAGAPRHRRDPGHHRRQRPQHRGARRRLHAGRLGRLAQPARAWAPRRRPARSISSRGSGSIRSWKAAGFWCRARSR